MPHPQTSPPVPMPQEGSRGAFVILLSSVAAIGGFLFGFDSGVINGTIGAIESDFAMSEAVIGFSVASVLIGSAGGALAAGNIADRIGRRLSMLWTAVLFLLSALGCGFSFNVIDFNVYRIIGGVAVGAASVLAPAYISEIAPAHLRGRLGSLQQLAIVIGLFSAFVSNYIIAWASGGADNIWWLGTKAWRWMFWVECVPAIAFFLGTLLIPESPRHLVAKGKLDAAESVFARILTTDPKTKVQEVLQSLNGSVQRRASDVLLPNTRRLRPIVITGILLAMFQQFVGINVIFYYGETLWRAAGMSTQNALAINVITGTTNILSTLLAIALIDRLGRKPLLVAGSIGMVITLGTLAIVFATGSRQPNGDLSLSTAASWTGLIAANLYIVAFGVSWGPIVWVMLGEMFSNQFRGPAMSIASSANWIANFAVTLTFPILLGLFGLTGAYTVYTLAAAASLVFVLLSIKETRNKKLEEM